DMLSKVIEFHLESGISGIMPGGSTGEFYALSPDERDELTRFVKGCVGDRALLTAGCNATTTADVISYSQKAQDLGYDAILLAPPYYSLPEQDDLLKHFQMVLDAVDLPLVLYNYPGRAGVEIGYDVMDGLADHPQVIAIKESSGDISRLYEIQKRYSGRIQLVAGSDDQAFDYFAWGVTAWVAGGANVAPAEHCAVLDAAVAGNLDASRAAMGKLMGLLQNMESGKYNQKAKYGMELQGYDCGLTRPPLMPLSDAEKSAFKADFDFMKG
ncbi:MAG: dihydrodipicolinate synthase family protein, partial [Rhodospirillales bacterium]|nr:dihydrodipicolinate synthase family protein [Rhodospirillales bacterium]